MVKSIPFVIAAVAARLALPFAAEAADISISRSAVYDGLQPIVVDAAWFGGAADGAVRVAVKGAGSETAYLQPAAGEKEVVWNPTEPGTYTLTLERQVGEAWEPTDYSRQLTVNGITTATAEDIELNLLASGEAVAEDTFVDIAVGTRTNAVMHPIVYSTEWTKGSDAVKIYQDGQLVFEGTGEGTTEWTPPGNGTYELIHRTFAGEAPMGSELKATFFVTGKAAVTKVSAAQRYPWNGMVDIAFTITGDAGTAYQVSFTAKDMAGGTNLTMRTVEDCGRPGTSAPTALRPGDYRFMWNAGADLPDGFESERVTITVEAREAEPKQGGLYMVVDLSGGSVAEKYPVSYLDDVPSGGWTDEYKTTKLVLRRIEPGTCVVTVDKPYYIGVFEVTQKQYSLVTGESPAQFVGDMLPVARVSYGILRGMNKGVQYPEVNEVDEHSYLWELRNKSGLLFDLPTEKQWEYACRAGATTSYSYGDVANGDYMWSKENSNDSTHIAGTRLPNQWGLYDMHGNVWEFCLELHGDSYENARVVRGGAYGNYSDVCVANSRGNDTGVPYWQDDIYGVRLCVTVE